jgi:pSer/pThr/pTyr-binding forkhead associated (FHA) protein
MNQEKGRDSIKIEVLKEGIIIQVLEFHKSKISFGRLEENDLILEHPSSSRTHAVLQVLDNGYFLMDLGSAHGTFLNKVKIPAKENVQVYAGDFVVFGQSTRKYILQVKDKKDEPKDSFKKTTQKLQSIKKLQQEEINEVTLMGRLIPAHVWKKDPKGVLCNWFEQQGYEMNIEVIDGILFL